jgi:tetratricopeptide (TPR) repeat protein
VASYREAVRLNPDFAIAHNSLGLALSDQALLDEAAVSFREAIRLEPTFPLFHNNLANVHFKKGEVDEAIAGWRAAIALDPEFVMALQNLATVLAHTGQVGESIDVLRTVIRLNPDQAPACNDLAWRLATAADVTLRDAAEAVTLAKKAVELAPEKGIYWNTLGVARYRADDWPGAVAALEKSTELRNGGDAFDWFFLAMAQWRLGEKDRGHRWYDRAVKWMDENASDNEELRRFRAEAAELLGVADGPSQEDASSGNELPTPKQSTTDN